MFLQTLYNQRVDVPSRCCNGAQYSARAWSLAIRAVTTERPAAAILKMDSTPMSGNCKPATIGNTARLEDRRIGLAPSFAHTFTGVVVSH